MTPVSMGCLEESWIASLTLCVRPGLLAIFLDLLRKTILIPLRFAEAGIEFVWKDYLGYPEYPQRYPRLAWHEHSRSFVQRRPQCLLVYLGLARRGHSSQ